MNMLTLFVLFLLLHPKNNLLVGFQYNLENRARMHLSGVEVDPLTQTYLSFQIVSSYFCDYIWAQ